MLVVSESMSRFSPKIFSKFSVPSKPKEIEADSELLVASTFVDHFQSQSEARNPLMPMQQPSIEAITTSVQYRHWLVEQAERWRTFEGEPKNHIEKRRQFFAYAKQCIANSAMNPRERTLAITALQETERAFRT